MFYINDKNRATKLKEKKFSDLKVKERDHLQEWIAHNPKILKEDLLIIQKEFAGWDGTSERLDLLALDKSGNLVIIENKTDDSGKDVVWQALKYASYCAILTHQNIQDMYQKYLGTKESAEQNLRAFFDKEFESVELADQRIILVANTFRKEVTSTVLWLIERGINIKCVKVQLFVDNKTYLNSGQILPISDIGDYQIKMAEKRQDNVSQKQRSINRMLFWEKALPRLREVTAMFENVNPAKENWLGGATGVGGVTFQPVILEDSARVELSIRTKTKERNKEIFAYLFKYEKEIEKAFGKKLNWKSEDTKTTSDISYGTSEFGGRNQEDVTQVVEWLATELAKLKNAIEPYLNKFKPTK
ncbi:MAG: DUF4268 domain-containing protein [Firmicutes bacterium]|nr:DUF4268 domain-containing protein [Bacillota bacterium]MCL2177285.1 DUF4268 domain-containing protein [Bacillota bacterium]